MHGGSLGSLVWVWFLVCYPNFLIHSLTEQSEAQGMSSWQCVDFGIAHEERNGSISESFVTHLLFTQSVNLPVQILNCFLN